MPWHAHLRLDYQLQAGRCVARFEHDGPLRILQSLYPEGDAIAHNVVVHPPGGLVGGDTLEVAVHARGGSHGLVTTPGATRFYRSDGEEALQRTRIVVDDGARIEWLPLEAICHSGCIAANHVSLHLAPGGEVMGWDVTALGLPASGQPFVQGSLLQHIELEGAWLERGRIAANDTALMDGPLGLASNRCTATLFFAAGADISRARRDGILDAARAVIDTHELRDTSAATAPGPRVIVVRVLAPLVEPAMQLLKLVRDAWRPQAWNLPATRPRTWAL